MELKTKKVKITINVYDKALFIKNILPTVFIIITAITYGTDNNSIPYWLITITLILSLIVDLNTKIVMLLNDLVEKRENKKCVEERR